jgi:two-component system, OmpR family, phosphate regulon sensor histidine kinase PhoR
MGVGARSHEDAGPVGVNTAFAAERALLHSIVEAIPAGVVAVEAETGRLVLANEEARRIFGMLGTASVETWSAWRSDGRAYTVEDWPLPRSRAQGEPAGGELVEVRGPNGELLLLDVRSVSVPDAAGGVALAVAMFQDVTARERRERAEREFVTNAAHELLTPLAAITSSIEVLQGGAKDDAEQRDRFLAHAEREIGRLGRLSHALLVLARAQMGTEEPRGELVDLAQLLREVADGLRPYPDVTVDVDCPMDLALVTNRALAAQALVNVGDNAAKFTRSGAIHLRARTSGESNVVVEISDSGPGITAGEKARIFERFYRSPDSPPREGFGLGLAIARQAVEAVGGAIEVTSRPGEGTTVALTWPGAQLTVR